MRVPIVRAGIAVWLGCLSQGFCQTPGDLSYENLFHRVVLEDPTSAATKPVPTVQESSGLTDREMSDLRAIAADCITRLNALSLQHSRAVLDALFDSIEAGKDASADRDQRLKELQDQSARIVLAHVQLLKAALGDARFQEFDARLRAEEAAREAPKPGVPAAKKR
jgi:hypothetical protein